MIPNLDLMLHKTSPAWPAPGIPRMVVVPCDNLQKQIKRLCSRTPFIPFSIKLLEKTLCSMKPMVNDLEQPERDQASHRRRYTEEFLSLVSIAEKSIGRLLAVPVSNTSSPLELVMVRTQLKNLYQNYVKEELQELQELSESVDVAGEVDEKALQHVVSFLGSAIRNQSPSNDSKSKRVLRNIAIILDSLKLESDGRTKLLRLLNEVKLLVRFLNGDHGLDISDYLLVREGELRKHFVTMDGLAQLKKLDKEDEEKANMNAMWFFLSIGSIGAACSWPPRSYLGFITIVVAASALVYILLFNFKSAFSLNSTNSNGRKKYEIFLNFRGDIRFTVPGVFHSSLEKENISSFFDERNSRKSIRFLEEIKSAISTSLGAITIFSEHYGDSEYCLDELLLILERETAYKGYIVRPIFYDVEPDDLTDPKSKFGLGLQKLFSTQPKHKVKKWKRALKSVTSIGGDVYKSDRQHLDELVNKVVKDFKNQLGK